MEVQRLFWDLAAPCRHCGGNATTKRRRGLCPGCHADEGIRERYSPVGVMAEYGARERDRPRLPRPPKDRTRADPGSLLKVCVMASRASAREDVNHEQDPEMANFQFWGMLRLAMDVNPHEYQEAHRRDVRRMAISCNRDLLHSWQKPKLRVAEKPRPPKKKRKKVGRRNPERREEVAGVWLFAG